MEEASSASPPATQFPLFSLCHLPLYESLRVPIRKLFQGIFGYLRASSNIQDLAASTPPHVLTPESRLRRRDTLDRAVVPSRRHTGQKEISRLIADGLEHQGAEGQQSVRLLQSEEDAMLRNEALRQLHKERNRVTSQSRDHFNGPSQPQTRRLANVFAVDISTAPSRASPDLEVAEIEGEYFDTTSGLTFLHRAYKKLSTQRSDKVPSASSGAEKHQRLMTVGDRPFNVGAEGLVIPDRVAALELMRFYFDECVVTYRMFHRQTVVSWLEKILSNSQNSLPLYYSLGHAKTAIVLAILAVVTFRREKIRRPSLPGFDESAALSQSDPFFLTAVKLTDAETGLPRLESAQARLVQVLYLLQTSRMNEGWYIFGTTSQIISAIGLHRRGSRKKNASSKQANPDYINVQCQRRTFWVAYTIDKYLSVAFGRPSHYRDEDIDQELPDCINDEDMTPQGPSSAEPMEDCYVDSLIFHARLAQIIGTISRDVYTIKSVPRQERMAAAHRAGRELHEWRQNLPPYLGTIRPSTLIPSFRRQATALKLAYSHAIIHANRPFLLGQMNSTVTDAAAKDSVTECISAAKVLLETVDSMAGDGSLFHAFWWTHYVTFCAAAVVYVLEIQQKSNGAPAGDKTWAELVDLTDRCLSHLSRGASADSPNRRYSIILEELKFEARNQVAQPTQNQLQALGHDDEAQTGNSGDNSVTSGPVLGHHSSSMEHPPLNGFSNPHAGDNGVINSLLEGWQTTDWLDLDSSVGYLRA
ncbi:hypothetical protein jhhlp_007764 [Lomentospora prolificans]|uniref:Xylanolytic transcriptional activator regulatory domain-containing protein n=1 Tax=Lomentospora prolificans TaxID=41688 RepID=A0A2N3N0H6_9PEZI|nr:hypothetical protein jhhlp_007764 [Lomentospora prolificans]